MEERRHIAVMFTDIVGYTALMGSDEDKADRYAICDVRCEICDCFWIEYINW